MSATGLAIFRRVSQMWIFTRPDAFLMIESR